MKHTVIGMAGHIDHGKTALIRALTGIQTDQLPQEQERGITIDLGFAYWKPNVTIIDVPGHEKFIRNMVAGVSTVDLFMLVIAADDGIMPQTREHLEILRFFNVQNGIVALNKTDLVDPEWLELVSAEIDDFLGDYGYSNVSVIPVSTISNFGIESLTLKLEELIGKTRHSIHPRPFRLNIDRSFEAKGFGNIITGTVLSGMAEIDKLLVALPEKYPLKIRSLEVHQQSVQKISAGQRAAVNLSSAAKVKLHRGQTLVEPGTLKTVSSLLAQIKTTALFKFKIKRLSEVRVHIGTSEVRGLLNWFEDDSNLTTQREYSAHLKLLQPAVAAPDDAILLRSYSPVTTIAGGKVLQIDPPKLARNSEQWKIHFSVLRTGSLGNKIRLFFENSGHQLFSISYLGTIFFEPLPELEIIVEKLKKQKVLNERIQNENVDYLYTKNMNLLIDQVADRLEELQQKQKIPQGLHVNEIPALLPSVKAKEPYWIYALQKGVRSKKIMYDGLHYFGQSWENEQTGHKLEKRLVDLFLDRKFMPPDITELLKELELSKNEINVLIQKSIREKILVSISGVFYLHHRVFEDFLSFLRTSFSQKDKLDVAEVRAFTQSTRKYIIPLLEFTDRADFTRREGDKRLRGKIL